MVNSYSNSIPSQNSAPFSRVAGIRKRLRAAPEVEVREGFANPSRTGKGAGYSTLATLPFLKMTFMPL